MFAAFGAPAAPAPAPAPAAFGSFNFGAAAPAPAAAAPAPAPAPAFGGFGAFGAAPAPAPAAAAPAPAAGFGGFMGFGAPAPAPAPGAPAPAPAPAFGGFGAFGAAPAPATTGGFAVPAAPAAAAAGFPAVAPVERVEADTLLADVPEALRAALIAVNSIVTEHNTVMAEVARLQGVGSVGPVGGAPGGPSSPPGTAPASSLAMLARFIASLEGEVVSLRAAVDDRSSAAEHLVAKNAADQAHVDTVRMRASARFPGGRADGGSAGATASDGGGAYGYGGNAGASPYTNLVQTLDVPSRVLIDSLIGSEKDAARLLDKLSELETSLIPPGMAGALGAGREGNTGSAAGGMASPSAGAVGPGQRVLSALAGVGRPSAAPAPAAAAEAPLGAAGAWDPSSPAARALAQAFAASLPTPELLRQVMLAQHAAFVRIAGGPVATLHEYTQALKLAYLARLNNTTTSDVQAALASGGGAARVGDSNKGDGAASGPLTSAGRLLEGASGVAAGRAGFVNPFAALDEREAEDATSAGGLSGSGRRGGARGRPTTMTALDGTSVPRVQILGQLNLGSGAAAAAAAAAAPKPAAAPAAAPAFGGFGGFGAPAPAAAAPAAAPAFGGFGGFGAAPTPAPAPAAAAPAPAFGGFGGFGAPAPAPAPAAAGGFGGFGFALPVGAPAPAAAPAAGGFALNTAGFGHAFAAQQPAASPQPVQQRRRK